MDTLFNNCKRLIKGVEYNMKYNDVSVKLNQNYHLTNYYTKGRIMRLGLKSYEVDYLYREGFSFHDMIALAYKFNNKQAFCDFVRKYLIKNCWFN